MKTYFVWTWHISAQEAFLDFFWWFIKKKKKKNDFVLKRFCYNKIEFLNALYASIRYNTSPTTSKNVDMSRLLSAAARIMRTWFICTFFFFIQCFREYFIVKRVFTLNTIRIYKKRKGTSPEIFTVGIPTQNSIWYVFVEYTLVREMINKNSIDNTALE